MRQDLIYALRSLRKSPGYAAVTILTLALGIGANTAIFSVVNGVILKPLPYHAPERLVFITSQFPGLGFDQFWVSAPEFVEFAESNRSFQGVGAYRAGAVNLGTPDQPRRVNSAVVTSELMPVLGVAPSRGRHFTREDTLPGAEDVAVLSSEIWRSAFGGDESIVGRTVPIDGAPTRIVGIMPPGFDVHDERVQVWLPLTLDPANPGGRGGHFLYLVGRLRDDVSLAQAGVDLESLLVKWPQRTQGNHVPNQKQHRLRFDGLQDDLVGSLRTALLVLQGAVGFVLLIACANLANLMLARAESRQREFAIRSALGAGRWRLLRQFLTEGIVLAIVGGALGAALGFGGLRALLAANPESLPRSGEIALDPVVLVFTLLISLLTGVLFGLSPLLHLREHVVNSSLKEAGQRSTASAARTWLRRALVMSEVALAVVLVIGAGLLLRSFWNLTKVDAGFNRSRLVTFGLVLPNATYQTPQNVVDFFARLQAQLGALPGVQGVAAMQGLPPQRQVNANDTDFEGYTPPPDGPFENVDYYQTVTPAYLTTLGIPLLDGRDFAPSDAGGPAVALVNETLAKTFFRDQNPLGRRLRRGFNAQQPWFTIVGVVRDVKQGGVAQKTGTEIYFLADQGPRVANFGRAQHEHRDPIGAAVRRARRRRPPRGGRDGRDAAARQAAHHGRRVRRDDRPATIPGRAADDCRRTGARAGGDRHLRHPLVLGESAPERDRHSHGDGCLSAARARDGARAGHDARRRGAGGRRRRVVPSHAVPAGAALQRQAIRSRDARRGRHLHRRRGPRRVLSPRSSGYARRSDGGAAG